METQSVVQVIQVIPDQVDSALRQHLKSTLDAVRDEIATIPVRLDDRSYWFVIDDFGTTGPSKILVYGELLDGPKQPRKTGTTGTLQLRFTTQKGINVEWNPSPV